MGTPCHRCLHEAAAAVELVGCEDEWAVAEWMFDDDHRLVVDRREEVGLEHVVWLASGDDGSLVHEDDAVRVHRSGVEVVKDDESRSLLASELGGSFHDSFLMRHVEGSRRFVEKNDRSGLGDDSGERHPSLFTLGQRGVDPVREPRGVGLLHGVGDGRRVLVSRVVLVASVGEATHFDNLGRGVWDVDELALGGDGGHPRGSGNQDRSGGTDLLQVDSAVEGAVFCRCIR